MQNFKPFTLFTLFTYIYIAQVHRKIFRGEGGNILPKSCPIIPSQYHHYLNNILHTHTHPPPAPHFAELVIHQSNRVDMYISYFFAASKNEKNFLGIKCALPIL